MDYSTLLRIFCGQGHLSGMKKTLLLGLLLITSAGCEEKSLSYVECVEAFTTYDVRNGKPRREAFLEARDDCRYNAFERLPEEIADRLLRDAGY